MPKETRERIAKAILDDLNPTNAVKLLDRVMEPIYHSTEFSDDKLIDICRLIALGQSEENACSAAGVPLGTLRRWKDAIPDVKAEILRAKHLSSAAVMGLFRTLMASKDEKIALDAMKFYLSRRTKEFREKIDLELEVDLEKLQKKVREDLYGQREVKPAKLNTPAEPMRLPGQDLSDDDL